MKTKRILAVMSALCIIFSTGCSKNKKAEKQLIKTIAVTDCINGQLSYDKNQMSETEIINKCKNLKASEEFTLSLPSDISYISNFTYVSYKADSNKTFLEQFKETFSYIFNDVEFDESCLYYDGDNSNLEYDDDGNVLSYYKTVSEMYDKIISDEENVFNIFYDDVKIQSENRAFMLFQSPFCTGGLSNFNRGEFDKIYHAGDDTRYRIEISFPQFNLPTAETVLPDSQKIIKVDDKDIMIADAVKFYEDYVNSLPYPKEANVFTRVAEVNIIPFENSTNNCIGFSTTIEYNNIMFDYTHQAQAIEPDYFFVLGLGAMVKTDEVDSAYGIYRNLNITEEKKSDKMIPFESAVQIVSESLTDEVTFEVQDARLVYSTTEPDCYDREKDFRNVTTSWKLTLYNKFDEKYYLCYVDATTGKNFRYFSGV